MQRKIKILSLLAIMSTLFSCNSNINSLTSSSSSSSKVSTSSTLSSSSSSSSSLISPSVSSTTSSSSTSTITSSSTNSSTISSSSISSTYGLTFILGTASKDSYNKDIDLNSNPSDIIRLKVTKDNIEVTNESIEYSISGDVDAVESIKFDVLSNHNYATVNFKNVGNVTITFHLSSHSEVNSVSVTYKATKGFLNKSVIRGNITEENGKIIVPSNVQATAVAYKADTKWVLSATMEVPLYSSSEAFGIGSFIDEGNLAFWSALRNSNKAKDGKYEIYIRDFLAGWSTPNFDKAACDEYKNLDFPVENEKTVVNLKLIRNGLNYYFDINGYHYQYTSNESRATYPGFFSQNQSAVITNYKVSYEQSDIDKNIEVDWGDNAKLDILNFSSKDSSALLTGGTRAFNIVKAPEYAKEEYQFSINDEFKDYVEIKNNTIVVDKYAPEGLLEITLSSASGKLSDKYSIQITKDALPTESELIQAKGGAYLSSDNSVVFPETLYENNGIGDETKYDSSPIYGALLKENVYGCSFTLEFDVNNYDSHEQEKNNLLISLGGRFNQYYFSFDDTKGTADVNVYTQSLKQNSTNSGSKITAEQISGLSGSNHHVKIHSNEGIIEIEIDKNTVKFLDATPLMNLSSFFMELPVRIATSNASCEVKNITVQKGELSSKNIYAHNPDYVYEQDNKYVISMQTNNGWDYRDQLNLNACTFKELGKCKGAYKVKFKATLEGANSASKFCIRIGDEKSHEAQICFGENKIENGDFQNKSSISIANNDTVYVTIYRTSDGKANIGVAKNENDEPTYIAQEFTNVADNGIWLWARNSKPEKTKKIYVENIMVENL